MGVKTGLGVKTGDVIFTMSPCHDFVSSSSQPDFHCQDGVFNQGN